MRTRDSFGEAMAATWKVCLSEPVRAGDPLVVQDIARASRLSATPVREALAWLAGHGLVERRMGRGYFVPDPSAAEVAQLYELHCRYLLWSLEAAGSPGRLEPVPDALNVQERTAWLFRCIMMGCGDAAMAEAQGRAAARLRLFWRAEQEICWPDPSGLARAEAAFFARQPGQVRLFVADYHGERVGKAGQIAAALRSPSVNISQI